MARKKAGTRFTLLLYQRFWSQIWRVTLLFGLLLFVLWFVGDFLDVQFLEARTRPWLLLGALVSLLFTLVALLARRLCYVQARQDHLRVVTPFFPLRVSYRRYVTSRAGSLAQFFPAKSTRGAQRRFLEPYYNLTILVVEMKGSPLPPWVLKLFLSGYVFADRPPRLILVVEDWMKLSTELDSYVGAWRQQVAYQRHRKKRGQPYH